MREKLYLHDGEIRQILAESRRSLSECVILSTCNRTEFYGVSDSPEVDPDFYKNLLIDFKGARDAVRDEHFFTLISCAACQQVFNVATSIDSKIIGDSQILRQLRKAYSIAHEAKATGKVLNQLLQRAFKIGKKTFSETSIHDGAVSVSLAAVELAVQTFGSLAGRSVLIVGGGETARLTAGALANRRVGRVLVTNRTRSYAEQLLAALPEDLSTCGDIIDFENFTDHLDRVDIVISSTSSDEPIIYKKDVIDQRKKILMLDIAVPRDIEASVAENPNVVLRNIDDLNSIIDESHVRRMKDLPKAKKLVMTEMVDFLTWYYSLPLMPTYEKTGSKPVAAQSEEIIGIKNFLARNVSEIHKLAANLRSDFRADLESHFSLVRKLQLMKAAEAEDAV